MEVAAADAASGQGASSGNTGQANSLSDAISAAIQASRTKETAPVAEATEASPPVESVEKAGDKRDGEDAARPETTADTSKVAEAADKTGDAPKAFEPPSHWPEADRKAFAGLQPDAQSIIRRLAKDLEGGFTRRSQELGSKAKYAEAVSQVIDDATRQQLASTGANEVQYFTYLHQLQQYAAKDAPGFVKWVMQNNGVTAEQLGIHASQPAAAPSPNAELEALLSDPKVKELEAKLAAVEGKFSEREKAELRAVQQREGWQRQQLVNLATGFRAHLDDSGQLKYPHFDAVYMHMGALMQSDPDLARMQDGPEKMHNAYEMAVWARPDLRQNLLEAEATKRVQAAEKAREVARAKSVTAVKPGSGVATTSAQPKSLDEIIRAAMASSGVRP